ncbi:FAD binding domain-containing protein [Streptomyces purpurogeneiscleroticus]|uniref:FAD binding domain-containing protein n=1 Tax=Streptomyces purpurogeneiscleroticus TaxID=68259 RepID=UPI001CBD3D04|nr:xanthine dehydrogenase family protein subunit M [Streptomyces purpurogeneiscleroticus]MBZ4017441.1 molybdopterin dehydrogenase [Streptomyces purpurogeneiscleroticus]
MKPAPFRYHRARSAEDATRLLAELGADAKVIAGGQSLVAMMNYRLARPAHLVDIGGLRTLDHLRTDADGGLHIGALTTHHTVETAPTDVLEPGFGVLRRAMRWIGHLPIRTRGTVGGSLAHADATAEWCLLAVALGAELVAEGPHGRRRIRAEDFFFGYYTTALDPGELLVEVVFPRPAPHAALTEFAERQGDFATVAAVVDLDAEDGTVRGGRVALGGVAPAPVRVPEAEAVLAGGGTFAECAAAAADASDPPGDANGSPEYRRHLIRTLVQRACEEAMTP